MKKLIICLAVATIAVSCKKIQAGGNKGALKLEEGVERYSDAEQTSGHEEDLSEGHKKDEHATHEMHKVDTLKTDSTRAHKSPEVTTSRLEKPSAEQH